MNALKWLLALAFFGVGTLASVAAQDKVCCCSYLSPIWRRQSSQHQYSGSNNLKRKLKSWQLVDTLFCHCLRWSENCVREQFPEKTVSITVDDAFKSVINEGWPRLKAAGLPMTLFVSTDPVDEGNPNYMSWDDIRTLESEGVEIAHHTASHLHMIYEGPETSLADIKRASERFETELGYVPKILRILMVNMNPN